MSDRKPIACVTGGTGMVGKEIVTGLLTAGYSVRVITRAKQAPVTGVDFYYGDLTDNNILDQFLDSAEVIFHCAAELNDPKIMYLTNVVATERLLSRCSLFPIKYFCYMSSAGVVGRSESNFISEATTCAPQNEYERTKYLAEKLVMARGGSGTTVVLRPTNVISFERPGAFLLPIHKGVINRLKVFVKGGEPAHIVHSRDVARAALFFLDNKFEQPECFFVGNDEAESNTFAGVWGIYSSVRSNVETPSVPLHLPQFFPRLLRRLLCGRFSNGSVCYSSEKLRKHGFEMTLNLNRIALELVKIYG